MYILSCIRYFLESRCIDILTFGIRYTFTLRTRVQSTESFLCTVFYVPGTTHLFNYNINSFKIQYFSISIFIWCPEKIPYTVGKERKTISSLFPRKMRSWLRSAVKRRGREFNFHNQLQKNENCWLNYFCEQIASVRFFKLRVMKNPFRGTSCFSWCITSSDIIMVPHWNQCFLWQ